VTTAMQPLTTSARKALAGRLEYLRAQRAQAKLENAPQNDSGDAADRAENVEALIRLEELEARIATLELQLQAPTADSADPVSAAPDTVRLGSHVTLLFEPSEPTESFVIGPVEQSGPDVDVITPTSPLGLALLGVGPGAVVKYRAATGVTLQATVVALD
jgi:transcription elongation factor GreA